jgi:hypothetical protein
MTTALAQPAATSSIPATSDAQSSVQLAMELLGGRRVLQVY